MLVLALDDHDRQVLGVVVDEAFEDRIEGGRRRRASPPVLARLLKLALRKITIPPGKT